MLVTFIKNFPEGVTRTRFFCLCFAVALAGNLPIREQDKKDPPKDFTNSLGMKLVWIPPGTFLMGSPKEEKQKGDNETQHKVTLTKGFYLGVFAVTQEQWKEVMGYNLSEFKGEKNLPVETVSWNNCQEFIKKLKEKDKKPYRPPTEAEWEYSCRAGTTTPFHFGETMSTDQANYRGNFIYGNGKKGVVRNKTTPVGSLAGNRTCVLPSSQEHSWHLCAGLALAHCDHRIHRSSARGLKRCPWPCSREVRPRAEVGRFRRIDGVRSSDPINLAWRDQEA